MTCGICVFFFILILNTCSGPEEKFFWYWQKPWGSGGTRLVSNLNIAQSSVECVDRIPKIATPAVHWLLLFQDTKTHSPSIAHITFLWSDIEEIPISTQSHKLTLIFRAQSDFEMFTRNALEAEPPNIASLRKLKIAHPYSWVCRQNSKNSNSSSTLASLISSTKTHSPSIAHITFLWRDSEEISISTQSHKLTLIFRAQSGFEMFTRDALEARVSKPTPVTLITAQVPTMAFVSLARWHCG